ncbi:MAG: 2-deoxy-5-keto-D-gluconate 6-phosphate aldolase domain-containing protein [Solirubrobacteraceae bacterium]
MLRNSELQRTRMMQPGYDEKLYILAFDHRGSFQKRFFGIEGAPDPEQTAMIADAKHLIFEGMLQAVASGAPAKVTGVLVDEQFGGSVPQEARSKGLKVAMPVERSGQDEFDFEYGEDFAAHIERYDPDFTKVLVRYNPDGAADANGAQLEKLKRLSDWLHEHDRKFLFELLVPALPQQLERIDGDMDRYDAAHRPALMRRSIAEIQDAGIEVDIWKIEGVDERADCEAIVAQARSGGRDGVVCVVLGRGADDERVDGWLCAAAPVDGYVGFAIGRSIWWDPLKAYVDGKIERIAGAQQIAANYLRFVDVYERAQGAQGAQVG